MSLKLHGGVSKWVLREVLYRHVPRELIERPKMGFGIPLDHWLRGPLRDWAEQLLAPERLRAEGLRVEPIRRAWQEHTSQSKDRQYALWNVLSYMAWKQNLDHSLR
jgi:asparagine synthase (glutamine-hydrolysing)